MSSDTTSTRLQLFDNGLPVEEMIGKVLEVVDLRPSTRTVYARSVRDFASWVKGRPLDPTVLVQYKNHLTERTDLSPRTKNLYLSAVRTVFRKLYELEVLERDFSKTVKSFVVGASHKKSPISDAQVKKVFTYLERKKDPRLLVLFNLLYRQGLRQKEVIGITVDDVDVENGTLRIQGKGRDDKELVFLHPKTLEVLKAYLDMRQLKDGFVFYSKKNPEGHLTTTQLYRMVKEVHEKVGVSNGPHSWRKVFTSKLIESGMDLLNVQRYTRHKSMEMLRVYYDRIDQQKTLPKYYRIFEEESA